MANYWIISALISSIGYAAVDLLLYKTHNKNINSYDIVAITYIIQGLIGIGYCIFLSFFFL